MFIKIEVYIIVMPRLIDKNGKVMEYSFINMGSVLKKGKRTIIFNHRSVNAKKRVNELISRNSFNKLFTNGQKMSLIKNTAFYSLEKKSKK